MAEDMRAPAMWTYDLEGIATENAGGCEQSGLGLGFSSLMGDTSREEKREEFRCHGRRWADNTRKVAELLVVDDSDPTITCYNNPYPYF